MTDFLNEERYSNPFQALENIGEQLAIDGASVEDLVTAAEQMSYPADSNRDRRNLHAFAGEFVDNPGYIRRMDRLIDVDNRAADRVTIQQAIGTAAITQAEQGES